MASSKELIDYCRENKDSNPSIIASLTKDLRGKTFYSCFVIHGQRLFALGQPMLGQDNQSAASPYRVVRLPYSVGEPFYTDYAYTKQDFLNRMPLPPSNAESQIRDAEITAYRNPISRPQIIRSQVRELIAKDKTLCNEDIVFYIVKYDENLGRNIELIKFPYTFKEPVREIHVMYKEIPISIAPTNNFSGNAQKEKTFYFERYSEFKNEIFREIFLFLEKGDEENVQSASSYGMYQYRDHKYRFYIDPNGMNEIEDNCIFNDDRGYKIYYDIAPQHTISYVPIDESLPQIEAVTVYDREEIYEPNSDYTYYDTSEKNNVIFFPIQPIQDMTIYYDTRQLATITFAPLNNTEVISMTPESRTYSVGHEIDLSGYNAPFYTDQNGDNYIGKSYRVTGDATLYCGDDKYVYLTIVNPHTNEAIALPYRSNETVDLIKLGLTTGGFSTDPEFLNTINGDNLKIHESMVIFYDGDDFADFVMRQQMIKP